MLGALAYPQATSSARTAESSPRASSSKVRGSIFRGPADPRRTMANKTVRAIDVASREISGKAAAKAMLGLA